MEFESGRGGEKYFHGTPGGTGEMKKSHLADPIDEVAFRIVQGHSFESLVYLSTSDGVRAYWLAAGIFTLFRSLTIDLSATGEGCPRHGSIQETVSEDVYRICGIDISIVVGIS